VNPLEFENAKFPYEVDFKQEMGLFFRVQPVDVNSEEQKE
jgi:hypothetical protein